jgi:hypothetical protein
LFELSSKDSRIDPEDGEFVDIIHTTGLSVAIFRTLGHVDFYVNGGIKQKGCFFDQCMLVNVTLIDPHPASN